MTPSLRRASARVPAIAQVEVRYEDFEDFASEYLGNVSVDGMFVRTAQPQAPGAGLEFEIRVEGGPRVIRGVGEVVWNRARTAGPDQPAGMGVRFISLDPDSRRMVRWLVERAGNGGAPAAEGQIAPAAPSDPDATSNPASGQGSP